jgi:hypothetical protein
VLSGECLGARGGELRGWRVAIDAQASPAGNTVGGPAGGSAGGHRGLGCNPRGICSGDARGPHHWPRARVERSGGGRRGRGGGTPDAACPTRRHARALQRPMGSNLCELH